MKMKNDDGTWTEYAKRLVWSKAPLLDPRNPDGFRLDPCRALMSWEEYGNRDSDLGWEIDHIVPEQTLKDKNVPQELIDNIDNLRPMHWRNNSGKSDDFPNYSACTTHAGSNNHDHIHRDYRIARDQINVLRQLFDGYDININHPTVLGQWQVASDNTITPASKVASSFFDDIVTPSIHDLD